MAVLSNQGSWKTSKSSARSGKPIVHFVHRHDGDGYCGSGGVLTTKSIGRYCWRCIMYLLQDGFLKVLPTGVGEKGSKEGLERLRLVS